MTTKEKYNHWKIVKFLKEHGEYDRYINKKSVVLTGREMKKIPKEIYKLEELKVLNLQKNQITYIPKKINYFKKIKRLNLDQNQIKYIPKEISHLKNNLKKLWIQNNPLKQTKEEIQQLLPNTNIY